MHSYSFVTTTCGNNPSINDFSAIPTEKAVALPVAAPCFKLAA